MFPPQRRGDVQRSPAAGSTLVETSGFEKSRTVKFEIRRHLAGLTLEVSMTTSPVARLRNQRGVTTAEYAVVTAAGCGFGGVLIKLLTSEWGQSLLKQIFDFFLKMIGLG